MALGDTHQFDPQVLKEDIILLQLLCPEPARPVSHTLPGEQEVEYSLSMSRRLSLERERDIVDSLAFLSATTEDPERVTAVCIEEVPGHDSCIIRIASNTGRLDTLTSDFERLSRILESTVSNSCEESSERMLLAVTSMNRNRILSRLRSKHAQKSQRNNNRPPVLTRFATALRLISRMDLSNEIRTVLSSINETLEALLVHFFRLENTSSGLITSGKNDEVLVNILKLVDEFPREAELVQIITILPNSGAFGPQGRASLVSTIKKLRMYSVACRFLVKAAHCLPIFREISVSQTKVIPPTSSISRASDTSFLDAVHRNMSANGQGKPWKPELKGRLGASLSQPQLEFRRQVQTLSPKVHAEIQLLFFYEFSPDRLRPRVICSSKSACFLCDLFIQLHGQFFVTRTHGVLYNKWALPDLDGMSLSLTRKQALLCVIQKFSLAIQVEIRRKMGSLRVKRIHPNESVAIFPEWVSSQVSLSNGGAPGSTGTPPVSGETPSVLNESTLQFLDADGESSSHVLQQNRLENDVEVQALGFIMRTPHMPLAIAVSQSPEEHVSIQTQPLSQPVKVKRRDKFVDAPDSVHGQSKSVVATGEIEDRHIRLNDQTQNFNVRKPHHSHGHLPTTAKGDLSKLQEDNFRPDQISSSEAMMLKATTTNDLVRPQNFATPDYSKSHKARGKESAPGKTSKKRPQASSR